MKHQPGLATLEKITPDRIRDALESRGLGRDSELIHQSSKGVKLTIKQSGDRVEVVRVGKDGDESWRYTSHKETPNGFVPGVSDQLTKDERDALLEGLQTLEHTKELNTPNRATQVEKPFKATPHLAVTTGKATQRRHEANRQFFDAIKTATQQHSTPVNGVHQLTLGNGLTSTVVNDQLIISRGDGKGHHNVVYGHSRETSHLSGTGNGHMDKLTNKEKIGAVKHVISLGKPKQRDPNPPTRIVSRPARRRQNRKQQDFGFDR